jgi:TP901 family phage tail tape measure protein
MAIGGKDTMKLVIAARDNTRGAFTKVGAQIRGVKKDTKGLNNGLGVFRSTLGSLPGPAGRLVGALGPLGIAGAAIAATAAIGFFAASTVKSFTAFEDSMANVRKTTGMTKEETIALGSAIDGMALRLPLAHGELAKIAAIAGQLGIQGKTSILGFTEDIAKMATAFDMAPESAATAMAKMANIYDIPIENVSALGSAINVLGNTTAAQESAIMDFAMSLGASAKQLGFCETEAIAMGATLISMGMDASASGTRLNAAFTQMAKNTDKVSKFLGKTETDFRAAFGEDPMGMITQITAKLALIEDPLERNATAAEMFGLIGAKSINALGGDLDGLQTNLANAALGLAENTSLTEEFAAKTDTLKAKFALVGNAAESFKINIGQALAPMAGILAEGASKGISGISKAFSGMQKVAGPILNLLLLRFHVLKAFLEGLFTPIIQALKPLGSLFGDTSGAVSKLNIVLNIMKDVFTIITGVARELGTILGTLIAKAITPLVAKIKEGIKALTEFYDKLGPVKGLIEGIKDKVGAGAAAIGEWADSFKETVPPAEELAEAVSELAEEAKKVVPVLTESIKTLGSRLTGASGSYKTAIGDISKEIDTLKDAWNLASDDQKIAIEKQIKALEGVRDELEHGEEEATKYFDTLTKKQEEFTIKVGETTITFKGMAAEIVKNSDAYSNLQKNAETLLDLDWSVFTDLEADLPNIDKGIGDMSMAFTGLKGVLADNIIELENVKQSVIDIAQIAAPFLEAGFLNGIKSIGNFAGALSDAGSAINTFSNLQEVSVDGCIDFSLHVNDMVSALQILDNQMEDLVPSFAKMDSLITDIADAFLYSGGKAEVFESSFEKMINNAYTLAEKGGMAFTEFSNIVDESVSTEKIDNIERYWKVVGASTATATRESFLYMDEWARGMTGMGVTFQEYYDLLNMSSEDQEKWFYDFLHTNEAITFQMDKQTGALKKQTTQLGKITDALQPYLEFMRTLNELAALSALSTEELNNGLNSIKDTLVNLSIALSTFDLAPVMKSLFGSGEEGEGTAKKFTDTMLANASKFDTLIAYIERLSTAITTLTGAFAVFEKASESVLLDETALLEVFMDITDIMGHFSIAMGERGFGEMLASSMKKMVDSTAPLTTYFKDNNAAVTQFNNTLTQFKTTINNVVSVMDRLQEMTAMTVPSIDELAAGFDKAAEFVQHFEEALLKHVGAQEGQWDMEKYFNSVFTSIKNLASSWEALTYDMGDSFETFEDAISTITGLIRDITSLTTAFSDMKDIVIPDAIAMEAALNKIPAVIKNMTELLGKKTWTDISANIAAFALKWDTISEGISESMDSFSSFVGIINKIVSACTEMTRIFTDMSAIVVIKSDEIAEALKDIPAVMAEVTKYLTTDSFKAIKDGLTDLNTEYEKHVTVLDDVMPSYNNAINMFSTLASNVVSLGKAFEELKDATIISSIDMDKAIQNIDVFINRFTDALRLNMSNLVDSLVDLDTEWKKHAEEMKVVMPSYETATKDIGTLINAVSSLGSALLFFSEAGSISKSNFDKGFIAISASIGNFTKSFVKNVDGLVTALKTLRSVWIENQDVLVPLMKDFKMISRSFIGIAVDAYNMSEAFRNFSRSSIGLKLGFERLIEFIKTVAEKTKEFYTPESAKAISQYVIDVGKVIYAFRDLNEQLETATKDIEKEVTTTVNNIAKSILSLKSLIPSMFVYGAALIISFATGMNAYKSVLENVLISIGNMIKGYLGVSSPTELGPLRALNEWPKNLVKSFASGIKSEMSTLNNSFGNMSLAAPGGASGGNITHVNFNITQNITDKTTADYSTRELERLLSRHEML